jgi:arylsulfatase A-like enzyme
MGPPCWVLLLVVCNLNVWLLFSVAAVGGKGHHGEKGPPHILLVVADDFGWGDIGFHRETPSREVVTPTMNSLARDEGIVLNRHYVHMTCTPSRSSLQTGRLPVHILTNLVGPCDINGAIPRNMTGIAAKLKEAGYETHTVGKWDVGMTTPTHTPEGRGYDTSLAYFSHGNWAYTNVAWGGSTVARTSIPTDPNVYDDLIVDLWNSGHPAKALNGTMHEEYLFRERIVSIVRNHDKSKPLFLNYNSKLIHYPLQAPKEYQEKFSFIKQDNRRMYAAMTNFLDDQLANITGEFKSQGLWDNTLMIFTADNGGYVKAENGLCNTTEWTNNTREDVGKGTACFNGESGANNYPLRGGKYSNFEGGIRVNAFASGGYLPKKARGTIENQPIHIADWYGTFCKLAGVNPFDKSAAASGLPPVDSVNVWPLLSGNTGTSPRQSWLVQPGLYMSGEWKYAAGGSKMIESNWGGPVYPNASTANDPIDKYSFECPPQGCLYNVINDIEERNEVSALYPDVVRRLKQEMEEAEKSVWSAAHRIDPECNEAAHKLYGGFYGPWKEL